jgi:flagellin
MGLSLNFNAAAIQAHRSLVSADRDLERVLGRLSSGERLQRAADDPADMIMAQGLRFSTAGLNQAVTNSESGINLLNTAEGAMDQLSERLRELRGLAVNAANDGSNSEEMLQALQTEANAIISSIDQLAVDTRFGSLSLLDGTLADNDMSPEASLVFRSFRNDARQLPDGILAGSPITIGAATADLTHERYEVTLTEGGGSFPAATEQLGNLFQNGQQLNQWPPGSQVTITGANGNVTVPIEQTTTIEQFVGLVNARSSLIEAQAFYDQSTGSLVVEGLGFGNAGLTIQSSDIVSSGSVGLLDSNTGIIANTFHQPATNPTIDVTYTDKNNVTQTVTLSQDPTRDDGRMFRTIDGSFELVARPSDDPGLGGTIALPDDPVSATRASSFFFQTGGESNQRTRVEIADMRPGALGQGISVVAGLGSLAGIRDSDAFLEGNAQESLAVIDAAIEEVLLERGRLGAVQEHALQSNLDSLRVEIENLTAAESRIRDVDFAEESAEYARLNIMYQAATAMLAQANQVPQSVLSLLQ